jgi:hypothetical protein
VKHPIVLGLGLALVAGCASTPPPTQNAQAAPKVECHRETPVGTMFAVTRCDPVTTESERQRSIDAARTAIPPGGNVAKPGAGG